MKSMKFTKDHRLLKKKDFDYLKDRSSRLKLRSLILYHKPSMINKGLTRIGISCSKKVGGSVLRNRLKRIIREWFRMSPFTLSGKDCLIVILPFNISPEELEQLLLKDLDKGFKRVFMENMNE